MSEAMLEKMQTKLKRLEEELEKLFLDDPRNGHGGTPHITDNAKGRTMMRYCDKLDERRRSKLKQIEEQKEKIRKMENRIAYRSGPTKKSQKFIEKNPIHQGLFELEKQGLVKQWARNPMYFFIVGLERVALATFDGKIGRCARFPTKTAEETAKANELIKLAESL